MNPPTSIRRIDNYELSIVTMTPQGVEPYPAAILAFAWADTGVKTAPEWAVDTVGLAWSKSGLELILPTGTLLFPTDDFGFPGGPLKRAVVEELIASTGGLFAVAFNPQGDPIASMGFPAQVRSE